MSPLALQPIEKGFPMRPPHALTTLLSLSMMLPFAAAAEPAPPPDAPPTAIAPAPAPEQIWPAGLARIAGRYRFIQIDSPGGLWQKTVNASKEDLQQISLNQLPK